MSFLKQHKQAIQDKFASLLISGYLRQQKTYKSNLQTIPTLIAHMIIIFYSICEHFTTSKHQCAIISRDQLTIINTRNFNFMAIESQFSVYLNEWIKSTSKRIITWTFKINSLNKGMSFGLMSNRKMKSSSIQFSNQAFKPAMDTFMQELRKDPPLLCQLRNNPQMLGHLQHQLRERVQQQLLRYPLSYIFEDNKCHQYPQGSFAQFPELKYKQGDIISFTLDLSEREVICVINGKIRIVLVENIEVKKNMAWRMVMGLKHNGDSVSILNCYEHA